MNGRNYRSLLLYQVDRHLRRAAVPLNVRQDMWFQHDGAPPHNALRVRNLLDRRYPGRWIGRGGPVAWPPRSPDLNPLDFFLWGHLKGKVYNGVDINSPEELQRRIAAALRTVTPDMVERAVSSLIRRAQLCIQMEGGHFQQLLH